jgi:acetyltransferase-like isoleucine patch superfamily enzyme
MTIIDKIGTAVLSVPELAVLYWPGPVGRRLRYQYFRQRLRSVGRNVVFDVGVQIVNPEWVTIGDNTWIDCFAIILAGPPARRGRRITRLDNPQFGGTEGEVRIGRNCHLASHSLVSGHGGLWVGDDITIAAGAKVYSFTHHYRDPGGTEDDRTIYKFSSMSPASEQALISGAVVLEDGAAVGLNSVVLPGSTIGANSWLGAQSLLKGNLPPGVIAGGAPARVLRHRF